MYIILEILILENFIINFLILYLTKIISRNQGKFKRIVFGAFIASLYSLAYFLPLKEFLLSILGKFIISMLIIRICFSYTNLKKFVKTLMAFYIISFIFAGATISSFLARMKTDVFNDLNIDLDSFPFFFLVIGVLISFIGCKMVFTYFNLRVMKENYIADVKIHYKSKEVSMKALLDTGNSLVDPFSRKKVMVVDYDILKGLLPKEVENLIIANNRGDYLEIEKQLELLKEVFKPTMIPYKSVGSNSILIGFVPDLVEISFLDKERFSNEIIVGLYLGSLTEDMGYSGLLNFETNWGEFDEVSQVQN